MSTYNQQEKVAIPMGQYTVHTVKTLLTNPGAYLISGPKRGGFNEEMGMGGGGLIYNHTF